MRMRSKVLHADWTVTALWITASLATLCTTALRIANGIKKTLWFSESSMPPATSGLISRADPVTMAA